MKLLLGKRLAARVTIIAGLVITPAVDGLSSTDLLNQIESYQSSSCQLIFQRTYTCSGVLVNNTKERGRPLILTAAHCIETEEDLDSVVVVFGKRKLLKGQPFEGLEWHSTGVELLSSSREIDFALLELADPIPDFVSPIFLGWNEVAPQPVSVSSIHFPDFGEAQYAFSVEKPSLAGFGGLYRALDSGHWKVDQWAQGITTLGSSGAPLLDPDFRIIGGMSGSTDWKNHKSDYFFRFDLAYDHFDDAPSQLGTWIDPDKRGGIGHYRPTRKIRNYQYTSSVAGTIKLSNEATVAENFTVENDSKIHGVYVVIGEKGPDSGATIEISLSQNGSRILSEKTSTSDLSRYSENYLPFDTPPAVSGMISVSLRFEAANHSDYISIPNSVIGDGTSYFLALNTSGPSNTGSE